MKTKIYLLFLLATVQLAGQSFQNAFILGAEGWEAGNALVLDDSSQLILTGSFMDPMDVDPGPDTFLLSPTGFGSIFLAKYDLDGTLLWANMIDAASSLKANDVILDAESNILLAGEFTG